MADIEIAQAEADALIQMEKRFVDELVWTFPAGGDNRTYDKENASRDQTGNILHRFAKSSV
ncbi:MAG: hypothetical protein LAP40_18995 [Acidobacteriia bacterium]|nr:hypothetical protein [Terriglobia bacterium]